MQKRVAKHCSYKGLNGSGKFTMMILTVHNIMMVQYYYDSYHSVIIYMYDNFHQIKSTLMGHIQGAMNRKCIAIWCLLLLYCVGYPASFQL